MKFLPTELSEVFIIEPKVFRDSRGCFFETYHVQKFQAEGISLSFVQDNCSLSGGGVLRGLHAQMTRPQGKLVRPLKGEIFDVAVDIRKGSPTFCSWVGVSLKAENFTQIYIPPGFAHGFCVLTDTAEVEYKCTDVYVPGDEMTIRWNDSTIGVKWPLESPILSPKDAAGKTVEELWDQLPDYRA